MIKSHQGTLTWIVFLLFYVCWLLQQARFFLMGCVEKKFPERLCVFIHTQDSIFKYTHWAVGMLTSLLFDSHDSYLSNFILPLRVKLKFIVGIS